MNNSTPKNEKQKDEKKLSIEVIMSDKDFKSVRKQYESAELN